MTEDVPLSFQKGAISSKKPTVQKDGSDREKSEAVPGVQMPEQKQISEEQIRNFRNSMHVNPSSCLARDTEFLGVLACVDRTIIDIFSKRS